MGDHEMELAEKEFGRWFVSKRTKLSNAAEHYLNAANKYKTAKEFKKSAHAFEKHAIALETLGDSMMRISGSYKSAAVMLKLAKDPKCMAMYDKAVNVLCDQGKHNQAAKMCKEMGELSQKEGDFEEALMHFEKAVDLYQSDDCPVQAKRCLEKVAELQIEKDPPDYSKAGDLYEELAKQNLETRLTRSCARKHFFRAAICIIAAGDAVLASEKGELFLRLDPSLGTGREGKLMQQLIKALEDYDAAAFTQAVSEYNHISRFDAWHVKVLLAGKAQIDPETEAEMAGIAAPASAAASAPAAKKKSSYAPAASYTAAPSAAASSDTAAAASATVTSTNTVGGGAVVPPTEEVAKVSLDEPKIESEPAAPEIPNPGKTTYDLSIESDGDDDAGDFFG